MQGSPESPGLNFGLCLTRLAERLLRGDADKRIQLSIQPIDAFQDVLGKRYRRELSGGDARSRLGDRQFVQR